MTDEEVWVRFAGELIKEAHWGVDRSGVPKEASETTYERTREASRVENARRIGRAADALLAEYKKRFAANTAYRGIMPTDDT